MPTRHNLLTSHHAIAVDCVVQGRELRAGMMVFNARNPPDETMTLYGPGGSPAYTVRTPSLLSETMYRLDLEMIDD